MCRVLGFVIIFGFFVNSALGAVKTDLYSASVPITSQSDSAINQAVKAAFRQVLVKVSGDVTIAAAPQIKRAEREVNQYLQQFTFETLSGRLFYQALFDEQKVNQLILEANFPIWSEFRPTALIWLVHQDNQTKKRELLSDSSFSPFKAPMNQVAQQRGIWLNFPLLDITDVSQVNVFDVWGRFDSKVLSASQRYGTEGVVVARLFPQKNLLSKDEQIEVPQFLSVEQGKSVWQLDWTLMFEGQQLQQSLSGPLAETLLEQFTTELADQFARFYSVQVVQGEVEHSDVSVIVSNVQSLEDFSRIQQLFSGTPFVNRATLVSVEGHRVTYHIQMMGDTADLERNLQLNDNIVQIERTVKSDIDGVESNEETVETFEFRWTPIK